MNKTVFLILAGTLAATTASAQTSLNIGASLAQGNSENIAINVGATNTQTNGLHEVTLKADYKYGEAAPEGSREKEKNVDNVSGGAKYRYLFSDPMYAYVNGDILHDAIAGIDLRLTVGPGIGTFLLKDDVAELSAEIGVAYVKEKLKGTEVAADGTTHTVKTDDDRMALRVAQGYKRALSETANVFQTLEWLPTIDDFGQYLLNAEIGAEAMMNDRMSLRLVARNLHNSDPAPGKKKDDFSLVGGIGYKL